MRCGVNEKLTYRSPYFKRLLSPFWTSSFVHTFNFHTAGTRRTSGLSLETNKPVANNVTVVSLLTISAICETLSDSNCKYSVVSMFVINTGIKSRHEL